MNAKMVNRVATYDFPQFPVLTVYFIIVDFHKSSV